MTDAKGLSEEDVAAITNNRMELMQNGTCGYLSPRPNGQWMQWHHVERLLASHAALAERLKACEGDAQTMQGFLKTHGCTPSMKASECDILKDKLKACEDERETAREWVSELRENGSRLMDKNKQLTADLALMQSRLESVQESNDLITRDWQEGYAKRQKAEDALAAMTKERDSWKVEYERKRDDAATWKAELAHMKADPEILVSHQANEAQRKLEESHHCVLSRLPA